MKSELLKEYKGTIPERCPETKQGEAAYSPPVIVVSVHYNYTSFGAAVPFLFLFC